MPPAPQDGDAAQPHREPDQALTDEAPGSRNEPANRSGFLDGATEQGEGAEDKTKTQTVGEAQELNAPNSTGDARASIDNQGPQSTGEMGPATASYQIAGNKQVMIFELGGKSDSAFAPFIERIIERGKTNGRLEATTEGLSEASIQAHISPREVAASESWNLLEVKTDGRSKVSLEERRLLAASMQLPLDRPQIALEPGDLSCWASQLSKERLLLLISYDSSLLFSAAQGIAAELSGYHRYYQLDSLLGYRSREAVTVNPSLPRLDKDPAAVIVADATKEMPSFLDPWLQSPAEVKQIQQKLAANEQLLLVYTNDRILGWRDDPEGMQAQRDYVPSVRVPFVTPRIRQQCERHQRDDWQKLSEEVSDQRQTGQWPKADEEFYNEFIGYLGRDQLLQAIESRRHSRPQALAEKAAAQRLLSPATPLENAVLFVATFFPDLPMRDFERLLLLLLEDRCQSMKSAVFVVGPDGEGRGDEVIETRPMREIWNESYPEVLKRCQLQVQSREAMADLGPSTFVVDFTTPELRQELRGAFFGPHSPIFLALVRLARAVPRLFEESQEMVGAAVRLMVDTALANPGEFAGPGLGGLLPLLQSPASSGGAPNSSPPAEAELLLPRYYPCLRAFQQKPQLRGLVIQLLQELWTARRYGELVELAWRLRGVGEFNALPWFKRLFDEGDEPARIRARRKLRYGVRSGAAAEVIRSVFRWLPETGNAGGGSAAVAKSFFLDTCEELLFARLRPRNKALANPLLAAAQVGGDALEQIAIAWLFHPATADLLRERAEEHFGKWVTSWLVPARLRQLVFGETPAERALLTVVRRWVDVPDDPVIPPDAPVDLLRFPALVLADWAVELLGQDPPPTPSSALYERLLAALVEQCNRRQCLALGVLWIAVEESLLDVLVFLEELDPHSADLDRKTVGVLRQDLQRRRRCVKRLRLDLQTRGRVAKPH
jgi:hypothetical protein